MTDIKTQFDPILRKAISKKNQVAVIPVGSIEQHGPHLPVSTDSDIVTEVARQISEKFGYLLLPTINYGVSHEHAPFFNLSLRESTLQAVLTDLCSSLLANGIRTVFIINGHHGNLKAVEGADMKLGVVNAGDVKLGKVSKWLQRVFPLSYWHFMEREFDHAGFVETSLMLAVSENVRMDLAEKGLDTDGMTKEEIDKIGVLASKSFPKATKNGIWGDPREATRGDGEKILAEIIENLGKKCQTCLTGHIS